MQQVIETCLNLAKQSISGHANQICFDDSSEAKQVHEYSATINYESANLEVNFDLRVMPLAHG
jgi:hypothetical protein